MLFLTELVNFFPLTIVMEKENVHFDYMPSVLLHYFTALLSFGISLNAQV